MALKLQAEIGLDGSGFQAGLDKVASSVKQFAASAFGMVLIEEIFRKAIDHMEQLANASEQLGVGVEFLQEMSFAARQTGKDVEKVTKFIQELNATRLKGDKDSAYARFGVTDAMRESGAEAIIRQLNRATQGKNIGDFTSDLKEIGGKTAPQLGALIQHIDELGEAAERAGAVIDAKTIASVKQAKDELQVLSDVLMASLSPAIASVMDVILHGLNHIRAGLTFLADFTSKPDIFKNLLKAATGLVPGAMGGKMSREGMAGVEKAFSESFDVAATDLAQADMELNAKKTALTNALTNPPDVEGKIERKVGKEKQVAKIKDVSDDSLIRVGNFLGSSKDVLESIGRDQVMYLKQIALNTAPRPLNADTTGWPP